MSVALLTFALIARLVTADAAPILLTAVPAAPAGTQPPANPPLRFKWTANQTHTYKVAQQTVVRETTLDAKTEKPVVSEARTSLTLVKKWLVKSVDDKGVATLEMSITEMKNEFRRPDGTSLVRDSANPEHAKEMAAYLNVPVVTVRVDSQGRIVEVKETKAGSAARLHAELPFRMTLPDATPAATQAWDRTFTMKLDPPLGTGESYDFTQKYTSNGVKDGLLTASVETTLKAPPKALAERVPLVPMLWTGEVYFNTLGGKYHAARLKVKAELPNYQGEGTKFEYESVYSEDAVEK
jgi:hypothetical protein